MKQEKGITLISLIIYIILLTLVISMLSVVSNMFYLNRQYIIETGEYISEFNKFNMYFIEDVKNNKDIYKISENEIIFEDGTKYTYISGTDNGIYRNKVKICSNIEKCVFSKEDKVEEKITKKIINVEMSIESSKSFETSNEYVLKYW